jgi:hypothetical protein
MSTFPEALPHDPIDEIFPDVFLVRGSFRIAPLVSIRRNMVVLREGTSLTVVNAVRMSPDGEKALDALGSVKHLVRLGYHHTVDDPYYRHRYAPTFWCAGPEQPGVERLTDGGLSPVARAKVCVFQKAARGEAELVVSQPQGDLLVTCDSVQHWPDTGGCSAVGAVVCRAMGLLSPPAKIGPIWVKECTDGDLPAMRPDFDRLLALDFRHLVSAHGDVLRDVAKDELRRSCEATLRAR